MSVECEENTNANCIARIYPKRILISTPNYVLITKPRARNVSNIFMYSDGNVIVERVWTDYFEFFFIHLHFANWRRIFKISNWNTCQKNISHKTLNWYCHDLFWSRNLMCNRLFVDFISASILPFLLVLFFFFLLFSYCFHFWKWTHFVNIPIASYLLAPM